jgi:hypothetical protein
MACRNYRRGRGKRGQMMQIVFIMILLVSVGLTLLIGQKVLNGFFAAVDEGGLTTVAINQTRDAVSTVPATFDYGMLFVVIGLTIGLVITSFQIPTHPVFMIINFFGIFVLVLLAMAMSNMYGEMIAGADSPFLDVAESFPLTAFMINYLPYICVILSFLSTVIMFSKGQSESQGGGAY